MKPKALIFDVFGTVVDWRGGVAAFVAPALQARGLTVEPTALADAWRAEYQPAMQRIREGGRGYIPLDDLHRENLDRALEALGIADAFDAPARDALNPAWEALPPWADVAEGMARLRERVFLAPCSNGSTALMVRLARFAGLRWDCILGADVARNYKPESVVYHASAAALRLARGEVMMVAAHDGDLRAARAAGLQTAFVPRAGEYGTGKPEMPTQTYDVMAEDFVDLARQIGG
ncbi:haloacid dehalogenase type II [Albimonas sp. CAU 1670]|uniref:haloacid dehalogenase type II n=1 Tax=Albimonas sp. CAU 1670 TaxID=3032599 RepID=UPI0023DAB83F|nr:haloacid dehalogenase type II [Albimonas sp. CAU 1670]MDF2235551.1 haloacid dehalogenase type II [Albimonas sp. CAU 1670]